MDIGGWLWSAGAWMKVGFQTFSSRIDTPTAMVLVGVPLTLGVVSLIVVSGKLHRLLRELKGEEGRLSVQGTGGNSPDNTSGRASGFEEQFKVPWVRRLVASYVQAVAGSDRAPEAAPLVEDALGQVVQPWERLFHWSVAAAVSMGLFGTFLGLVRVVGQLQAELTEITNLPSQTLTPDRLARALIEPLEGMDTAFLTSILGLLGSLVLSFVGNILVSERRTMLLNRAEYFLDARVFSRVRSSPIAQAVHRLGETISKNLDQTIQAFGQNLGRLASDVEGAMRDLRTVIQTFDRASQTMDRGSQRLLEFSHSMEGFIASLEGLSQGQLAAQARLRESVDAVARHIEALNASEEQRNERLRQLFESIGAGFGQTLQEGVAALRQVVETNAGVTGQLRDAVSDSAAAHRNLANLVTQARESLEEIVGRCDDLLTRWERSTQNFAGVVRTELASALKAQAETSAELLREIQDIARGFESSLDEGVSIVRDAIVDHRRVTEDLRDAVASAAATQRELVELVPQARGAVEHAIDRYDQLAQQWHEDTRSFVETLRQEIENAKVAHRTALERWNDLEASIRSVGDELQGSLSALSARLDGLADRWSPVVDELRKVVGDLTSGFQGISAALENGRLAYAEASSRLQEAARHIENAAEVFGDKLSGSFDRTLHRSLERFAGQLGTLVEMISGGLSSVRQSVDEVKLAHETGVLAVLRLHQEDLNEVRQHVKRVTTAIEDSLARLGSPVEEHFPQIASVVRNLEAKIDRITDHQAGIRNGAEQLVQAASQLSGYASDIALRVRSLSEVLPQVSVRAQGSSLGDSGKDAVPDSGAGPRLSSDEESTL